MIITLRDAIGRTESQIREFTIKEFETSKDVVDQFDILVADLDTGSWDGEAFFLLRRRSDGALFEVHASHCSCYGFEGQFEPEPTTLQYLQSNKFATIRPERVDAVRLALLNIHEGD